MKVISSKRKVSNHEYCCVYGCKSLASDNREISFHKFPEEGKCTVEVTNKFGTIEKIDKRKAWIMAIHTGKAVTSRTKICSLHFSASDYVFSELEYQRPRLKKSAVPTLQLPMQKIVSTASKARAERVAKREAKKANKKEKEETVKDTDEAVAIDINEVGVDSTGNNETLLIADEEKTKVRDIDVQTDFYSSYYDQIKSDRELSTATGIPNFEIFHVIVSNVKELYNNAKSKLSVEEKVMLTFIKLKQNISFAFLSTLFNCYSVKTCRRIFVNMIRVLRACFDSCIHWPSKQKIRRNIPNCFLPFPDIRIILDCTEILLQKPKSVCCQAITYSNYKSNYTLKFMTGVTPAGTISFVSRCYGGRFSDKAIFEQSNLFSLLEKHDRIMIARGFFIDAQCKEHDIQIVRPPFLKNKSQLSAEEALLSQQIAKARVHIERSNQRLKVFNILKGRFPISLIHLCEDIFIIICGLVNVCSPILNDDKFPV